MKARVDLHPANDILALRSLGLEYEWTLEAACQQNFLIQFFRYMAISYGYLDMSCTMNNVKKWTNTGENGSRQSSRSKTVLFIIGLQCTSN